MSPRGMDRAVIMHLSSCRWIEDHLNCLIIGLAGVGESCPACALIQKARLEDRIAFCVLVSRRRQDLILPGVAVTGTYSPTSARQTFWPWMTSNSGGWVQNNAMIWWRWEKIAPLRPGDHSAQWEALAPDHWRSYPDSCHPGLLGQ